jgi:uncharacterized repeat protein (TIGR01451 family)/fimbrial isopeptide formation D2 family protein
MMNAPNTNHSAKQRYSRLASVLLSAGVFCLLVQSAGASFAPDESIIINRAQASYEDVEGRTYQTDSPTVMVSVLAVPAVTITPDETTPSAIVVPNESVSRIFRLCNSGNREDFFLLTRAEVSAPATINNIYFDSDNSGTVTPADGPVVIGQTLTPRLAPGGCLSVLVQIDTNNISPPSQMVIGLTARSTLLSPNGGFAQDDGTIINSAGTGAAFTAPGNAGAPPEMLVENLPRAAAGPGQTLNYTIAFRNSGTVPARQVRVVDDLPVELEYVAGSLRLNNRSLTDADDADEGIGTTRRIALLVPEIAPDAVTVVQFQARLSTANTSGNGVTNFAALSAANAGSVNTSNAVVVVNPIGTIYAGNSAGAVRIAGAQITIAVNENAPPLILVPDAGYAPNAGNSNPFVADTTGGFGFTLADHQIGTTGDPVRYVVTVTAPNFRPRSIEVQLVPSGTNGFYQATLRALDGQALAAANDFTLTNETVQLNGLAALVFNIPMFELSTLQISKSADKQSADIGEIVSYRIQVKNATASAMREMLVRDSLPPSFIYAAGTALVETGRNARNVEPTVNGNELTFDLGEVAAGLSVTLTYRLRVGANASEGEQTNSAVAWGTQPNGARVATEPARAVVRVRGGIFSMRQVVIGRVFEDRNGNGQFDADERPVAGARIYANNGQSVVTDSAGQYNLPAVSQGSLVLSLDPITLPDGYNLMDDDGRRSSKSWTRLLRTPLGGGALLRQNFAIAPGTTNSIVPNEIKVITAKGAAPASLVDAASIKPTLITALNNAPILTPPVKARAAAAAPNTANGRTSETFTVDATETIAAVAPGKLVVVSPQADEVIMSPALSINVRVAIDWLIEARVNGDKIDAANIGETRVDHRNQVTTISFVGINLRPGTNLVKLTAVGAGGKTGETVEFKVYGRGAVERLEIVPANTGARSGGGEGVTVEIRGFDQLGNPAADGQVSIETSNGKIVVKRSAADTASAPARQQMISLTNGTASVQLIGDGTADVAHLKAIAGSRQATADVRFTAELRPTLMVGLAELSIGRSAPEISSTTDDVNKRGRLAFYYRGLVFGNNLLTFAYDSQRALNRTAGRDRFGGFDPLDRAYPVFGDSSTRFEDAQSNSKIYARLDHGRSYAVFGDMEADLDQPTLSGYTRRLTGAKLHLENAAGDFITVTGARPGTAFARDVIPGGGLSLVRLSHGEILPGSEVLAIEVRDRRNPELILRRETLIRSIDYNLNAQTGEVFFLRPIPTYDYLLNLLQVVATYEHRGDDQANFVYTGRAVRHFQRFGLRVGASYINQQQSEIGAFQLGGIDLEKSLPRGGRLNFEASMSNGRFAAGVNVFDYYQGGFGSPLLGDAARERNGTALRIKLDQPLPFWSSRLVAEFQRSTADFYNPFGATIAPGNQRFSLGLEMHPSGKRAFSFGFVDERNSTRTVANSRQTFSALWSEQVRENLRTSIGFDHRQFNDELTDRDVDSNLVTAAIEYRPTSKIELSLKREQNLGEADPTYPNQTTLAASYRFRPDTKLFFTQRLASAPITPIGDLATTGFASTGARRETAFGIETKLARLGDVSGRYQVENGINGTDGFAVVGLQNRWALNSAFSVEAGFERGFLVSGRGASFNSATFGASWVPVDGFRASARYELRDRNGLGQLITIGAVGKIGNNWTTLARGQWSQSKLNERIGTSSTVTGALAYRPLDSDRYALLFSYDHRSMAEAGNVLNGIRQAALRDRSDSLSSDGLYQVNQSLELYGRFALRYNANGNSTTSYVSALTYLAQLRAQQRINNYLDFAVEGRWLAQPVSGTRRTSLGAELGYWVVPGLRIGVGYNFTGVRAPAMNVGGGPRKGGFYFTFTSKFSNLFNLFGTAKSQLATSSEEPK